MEGIKWKKNAHLSPFFTSFKYFMINTVEEKLRVEAPLQQLALANRQEICYLMVKKEKGLYGRLAPHALLTRHPGLQHSMRAMLLNWIIEVCDMYRLHRETFYLAVDFIDRFLSLSPPVHKNMLQLIGVTCIFIGAKIEETFPPKLQQFCQLTG